MKISLKKTTRLTLLAAALAALPGCPFWDPFNKLGPTIVRQDTPETTAHTLK